MPRARIDLRSVNRLRNFKIDYSNVRILEYTDTANRPPQIPRGPAPSADLFHRRLPARSHARAGARRSLRLGPQLDRAVHPRSGL